MVGTKSVTVKARADKSLLAGTDVNGAVTIDIDGQGSRTLPVSFRVTGSHPRIARSVDFGNAPVAAGKRSSVVTLSNLGDESLRLRLSEPVDPAFTVDSREVVVAPHSELPLSFSFEPHRAAELETSIPVEIVGHACGEPVTAIALRGSAWGGALGTDRNVVDFGATPCGEKAAPQTVVLRNHGEHTISNLRAVLDRASAFDLAPLSAAAILPGQSVDLTIFPKKIDAAVGVHPEDTLRVTSSDGDAVVKLRQVADGAALEIEPAVAPATRIFQTTPVDVYVTNVGTKAFNGKLVTTSDALSPPNTPLTFLPGTRTKVTADLVPHSLGAIAVDVGTEDDATLCRPTVAGTVRSYGKARATALGRGTRPCALVDNGFVACLGRTTNAYLVENSGPVATWSQLQDGPLCVTRVGQTQRECFRLTDTNAIPLVAPLDASVVAYKAPYVLFANGSLAKVNELTVTGLGYASQITSGPVSALSGRSGVNTAMVTYANGDVEAIEYEAYGSYPPAGWSPQTPWTLPGPARDARGSYAGGCALLQDGTVSCGGIWGLSATHARVTGVSDAIALEETADSMCALSQSGTLSCWGTGSLPASLGVPNATPLAAKVVPGTFKALSAGSYVIIALRDDGRIVRLDGYDIYIAGSAPNVIAELE